MRDLTMPPSSRWPRGAGLLCLCALAACGSYGEFGAVPGGAQDVGLFRETIVRGGVPAPEVLTVGGFLAEHDLPLEAPPCAEIFCVQAGLGVAPAADTGQTEIFVQLGLTTALTEQTFRRPPQNLAAVVSQAGTMAGDKIAAVRAALHHLVDALGAEDRLALIGYADAPVVLAPVGALGDRARFHQIVDGLRPQGGGSADLLGGLRAGFAAVAATRDRDHLDRLLLFSDVHPAPGAASADFVDLVAAQAKQDIGLTVIGVGTDFGQELARALSSARGGNLVFLSDAARISQLFDRELFALLTPVATDLSLTLTPAPGFRVTGVYGLPGSTEGSAVTLTAATAFLSRRRGAALVRLAPVVPGDWGDGKLLSQTTLRYRADERTGLADGDGHTESGYGGMERLGQGTLWFSQRGVARTVALVNAALLVRAALVTYVARVRDGTAPAHDPASDESALRSISLAQAELRRLLETESGTSIEVMQMLRADIELFTRLQENVRNHEALYMLPPDQPGPVEGDDEQPRSVFSCAVTRPGTGAGAAGPGQLSVLSLLSVPSLLSLLARRRRRGAAY